MFPYYDETPTTFFSGDSGIYESVGAGLRSCNLSKSSAPIQAHFCQERNERKQNKTRNWVLQEVGRQKCLSRSELRATQSKGHGVPGSKLPNSLNFFRRPVYVQTRARQLRFLPCKIFIDVCISDIECSCARWGRHSTSAWLHNKAGNEPALQGTIGKAWSSLGAQNEMTTFS